MNQSPIIELFELDASKFVADTIFRFCNQVDEGNATITYDGEDYTTYPIKAEGYDKNITGRFPSPTITLSNVTGYVSGLALAFNGFRNCPVTRRRVHYDDLLANNTNGELAPDVYFVDRYSENSLVVTFHLKSVFDRGNFSIPARRIVELL